MAALFYLEVFIKEPLTKKQQELVELNHNLIYKFANKNNLSVDEYYDVLAIGICNAASIFDDSKGAFSTLAFRCMENELNLYRRANNRMRIVPDKMIVSYDAHINTEDSDTKSSFIDIIPDNNSTHETAIDNVMLSKLVDVLTEKERTIVLLLMKGFTQSEIAKKFNCSSQNISIQVKVIRKKVMCIY
jgi:RNA polymerase sigma factor (sigma-70 family)